VGDNLLDGLLILQIGCFLVLLAIWPAYAYLKLRRRVRLAEERAADQIKHLHLVRGWSPTRIAESRGLRGRKQARLERIYAVLGIRREAAVEQAA
jgi:hypothetical protein